LRRPAKGRSLRRSGIGRRGAVLLSTLLTVAACGAPPASDGALATGAETGVEIGAVDFPAEVVIQGAATLISDATIDLALPSGIDVDGEGNLWIVDRRLHHVLVVSPAGEVLRTIGRNGGGPGEFRFPRGIGIRGDHAYVLDNAHGVQSFDMRGEYLAEYSARVAFDFDFTGDGGIVTSNFRVWPRGGLLAALGPDGEETALFGQIPFAGAEEFNFAELREAFLAGTLLDVARNGALPVVAPDGSLWVAFHTEQRLRRYGPDGSLLFETSFDVPELPGIEAQFYEDFRDAPSADALFLPSFIADGVAVGNSLLLLWETVEGTPGLVTVHDGSGALVQRLVFPEIDTGGGALAIRSLALDAPRRRLYIGVSDIGTIFAIDLPDQVAGF